MKQKFINAILLPVLCGLWACHPEKPAGEQKGGQVSSHNPKKAAARPSQTERPVHRDEMIFIAYLDDGDYAQLLAQKKHDRMAFINETDTMRNLNRGDKIQLSWKDGTVTMAGDDDAEMPAKLLSSVRKIADGPVSLFRKTYGKKLRYTWPPEQEFTSAYLDKVYLKTEYYLANTSNPLLKSAIANRRELTYSIESAERNQHHYTVIGIAPQGPNGSNVVQWLYLNEGDDGDGINEYDIAGDRLVLFDK